MLSTKNYCKFQQWDCFIVLENPQTQTLASELKLKSYQA